MLQLSQVLSHDRTQPPSHITSSYSMTSVARSIIDGGTASGGLAVHGHLELGRKLHREIARLLAAQDAIDIGGRASPDVYEVDSVGEQAAVSDKVRLRIERRYAVSGRHRYDRPEMRLRDIRHDDKAASRFAPDGDDSRFDLCIGMNGRNDRHDLE